MSWGAESSDEELMLGYRDGDAAAFDLLYVRHKGGVYRYLYRQCRDAAAPRRRQHGEGKRVVAGPAV